MAQPDPTSQSNFNLGIKFRRVCKKHLRKMMKTVLTPLDIGATWYLPITLYTEALVAS